MRVGLATLAARRARHVARQATAVSELAGIARYVVIEMDAGPAGLPLAASRNRAIDALGDCELAILLDADCIPSDELVTRYVSAARGLADRPALLCGPVGYLEPLDDAAPAPTAAQRARARERVIRAFPTSGVRREPRPELFWSLSFAVAPATHARIGGFDEGYAGWGAEDTDYGLRAQAAGVALWFVAGAWAYHQHHPPGLAGQLRQVAANARRFHGRWGFWPMPDRLAALAADGALEWEPEGTRCRPADRAPRPGDRQLRTSFL